MSVKEAFSEYSKPSVAIDTVILRVSNTDNSINKQLSNKKLQVLLVKEKNNTDENWHLPGTILRLGEIPIDAINRILKINKNTYFEQLYTVADDLTRDERGHIISIVYTGILQSEDDNIGVIDTNRFEVQWFWIDKLTTKDAIKQRSYYGYNTDEVVTNLKYDHETIINDSIKRIQGKLMYTDIGFKFISDIFTIKELENTFNAINERIIPGFRRYIKGKITSTGKMSSGNAYRPAELFRKNE